MTDKKSKVPSLQSALEGVLLDIFRKNPSKTFNYKQVAHLLHLHKKNDRKIISETLEALVNSGKIIDIDRGKYKLKPVYSFVEGIIDFTSRGAAYLSVDGYDDDIFIAPKNVK